MPEMEFYITDDERMELFEFVKDNEGVFIPDLTYDKPETIQIQSKEELIKCIYEQVVGFYVLSPRFQIEPMVIHKNKFYTEEDKYNIDQRTGCPYISFGFFRGFADDAPIKYKCTEFFHYARYLHYDWETNYGEFPATEELKAYYQMIVKFLKSKCKHVVAPNGKKYWVSKSLLEELALA